MTSVEVNIDDRVVESSAFIAFGVFVYLRMKVDTEVESPTRIIEIKKSPTLDSWGFFV